MTTHTLKTVVLKRRTAAPSTVAFVYPFHDDKDRKHTVKVGKQAMDIPLPNLATSTPAAAAAATAAPPTGTNKPTVDGKSKRVRNRSKSPKTARVDRSTNVETNVDTSLLGRVFVSLNSYRPPDVVRVIGFTKAMVIVEDVPLIMIEDAQSQGGSAQIDWKALDHNRITNPVTKGGTKMRCDRAGGECALVYKKEYYFEQTRHDSKQSFGWCAY